MWDSVFFKKPDTPTRFKTEVSLEDLRECEKLKRELDALMNNTIVQRYISVKQKMGKMVDKLGLTGHMTVSRENCVQCGNENAVIVVKLEAVSVKGYIQYKKCEACFK